MRYTRVQSERQPASLHERQPTGWRVATLAVASLLCAIVVTNALIAQSTGARRQKRQTSNSSGRAFLISRRFARELDSPSDVFDAKEGDREMLRVAGLLLNHPRSTDDATDTQQTDVEQAFARPLILLKRLPNGRKASARIQTASRSPDRTLTGANQSARDEGDDEDLLSDEHPAAADTDDDQLGAPSLSGHGGEDDLLGATGRSVSGSSSGDEDLLTSGGEDLLERQPRPEEVSGPSESNLDDTEDLLESAEELPPHADDQTIVSPDADGDELLSGTDEERLPEHTRAGSLLEQAGPPRDGGDGDSNRRFRPPPDSSPRSRGVQRETGAGQEDSDSNADPKKHPQDGVVSMMPQYEVGQVEFDPTAFVPDPTYEHFPYMAEVEQSIYSGKKLNPNERPWIELGRGMYLPGRMPSSQTFLGVHNLVSQHFLVYGDYRTATAYFDGGGKDRWVWAHRLNLDFDWMITDTERIHGFTGPIDQATNFTRVEFDNGDAEFFDHFDKNWDTIYFEGDVGSILGGIMGHDSRFDMPFAIGLMPLLFQNGVWMEDAFVGAALTIPSQHSRRLDWSNFEVTLFAGIDELDSPAFPGDDSAASVYGAIAFIEAYDGYLEVGYAFLDDTSGLGLAYHNVGVSFSRRYWHRVSNAMRVIVNAGQDPIAGSRTADGALFLLENALISSKPNTFVPYLNLFAGFGRPQSVSRAAIAGGVLRNTGILFETDGLTGFPFLDDTANNTYGGALGVNLLGPEFNYQVILEAAMLQTFGRQGGRRAVDDQYGIGARYQRPLTHAWLIRMDALYGFFENANNISGGRVELRYKF